MASAHPDVGDVDCPHLIGMIDIQVPEQVGVYLVVY